MNNEIFWILGSSVIIMLASLSGVFFVGKTLNKWMHDRINYFISFSAGVFLFVAYSLAKESVHAIDNILIASAFIASGITLAVIIGKLMPEKHSHLNEKCCESHNKSTAIKMMIGDAIHNVGDGFLLVPAFLINIELGILTTVGIFIHEAVQEISEFFVLKEAGFSTKKALSWNFLVSGTILIGVAIILLASSLEIIIGPLLGIASGIFLHAVFADLIPRSAKSAKSKKSLILIISLAILGGLIIFAVNSLSGHEEAHEAIHEHQASDILK